MCNYMPPYEFFTTQGIKYFYSLKEVVYYINYATPTGKLLGPDKYYIFVNGNLVHVKLYYSEEAIIESKLSEFLSFDYADIAKTSDKEFIATIHNLDKTEVSFTYEGGEIQIHQNKEDSKNEESNIINRDSRV